MFIYIMNEEPVVVALKITMNKNNFLHKQCYCYKKKMKRRKIKVFTTQKTFWLRDDGILKAPLEFYEADIRAHLKIQIKLLTKIFFWGGKEKKKGSEHLGEGGMVSFVLPTPHPL